MPKIVRFFKMLAPDVTDFFIFPLSHGIKTVINLQRPGEHASCGNPLEQESGFTYLPEAFMEAGSKSLHIVSMRNQGQH